MVPLPFALMFSKAPSITERVLRPRKSILTRPSFSTGSIEYCVTIWLSPNFLTGTISIIGFGVMTTPAACCEQCLDMPSMCAEMSSSFLTAGSVSYIALRSGTPARASLMLLIPDLRESGMSLVTRRTSGTVIPSALPTSVIAPLLFIRSKVIIWATLSLPYLRTMYSISSSLLLSDTSVSISGMLIRSGLRKRSKSRLYFIGSRSVIPSDHATTEPAADPLPGPIGIPLCFAAEIISATMQKYPGKPICSITSSS